MQQLCNDLKESLPNPNYRPKESVDMLSYEISQSHNHIDYSTIINVRNIHFSNSSMSQEKWSMSKDNHLSEDEVAEAWSIFNDSHMRSSVKNELAHALFMSEKEGLPKEHCEIDLKYNKMNKTLLMRYWMKNKCVPLKSDIVHGIVILHKESSLTK